MSEVYKKACEYCGERECFGACRIDDEAEEREVFDVEYMNIDEAGVLLKHDIQQIGLEHVQTVEEAVDKLLKIASVCQRYSTGNPENFRQAMLSMTYYPGHGFFEQAFTCEAAPGFGFVAHVDRLGGDGGKDWVYVLNEMGLFGVSPTSHDGATRKNNTDILLAFDAAKKATLQH